MGQMKVIAAYLLATLGGNTNPSADDLNKILGSIGAEVDEQELDLLLSEVRGKTITELLASGKEKLAYVPSGGAATPASAAAPPAVVEETKEEKVEEEEEDDGPLFDLFGPDN